MNSGEVAVLYKYLSYIQIANTLYSERGGKDNGLLVYAKLIHAKSKGSIKLKSANPFDHPLIDPRYLEEQIDVDVLLDGK